jgi:hypothetical protein
VKLSTEFWTSVQNDELKRSIWIIFLIQLANAESANAESANAESANVESANTESANAESVNAESLRMPNQ